MKRLWLGLFILCVVTFILYSYRGYYLTPWNFSYTRDLFDHSQWSLADSIRQIGDEGLYQLGGYNLVTTGELYVVNPEVPPLGKYLYGLSIVLFHNAYIVSLFMYLIAIGLFAALASFFFKNKLLVYGSVALFASEPIVFSQAAYTLLDLPLLIAMFIHVLALFHILFRTQKKPLHTALLVIICAIGFGAFIAIKIALLGIFVFLVDLYFLWKYKKLLYTIPIFTIAMATYVFTYLPYFLSHHSFIDFLKAQKWMLQFYLGSSVKPLYGMPIISLLFGEYKHWTQGATWNRFIEWTIVWPFYLFSLGYAAYLLFKRKVKNEQLSYFVIFTSIILCVYMGITYWVRYTLLVMPFFILLFVYFLSRFTRSKILLFILIPVFLTQILWVVKPSPEATMNQMKILWESSAYQDLYDILDKPSQQLFSRQEYWRSMQQFEKTALVEKKKISIKIIGGLPWEKTAKAIITINYYTKIGTLTEQDTLLLHRENGLWKMKWNDNLTLGTIKNGNKLLFIPDEAQAGKITFQDGTIIAEEGTWPFLTVIPEKIKDEPLLQKELYQLTGQKKYLVEKKYKANNQPDWPADIAFVKPDKDQLFSSLQLDPGLVVEQRSTFVYNIDWRKINQTEYLVNLAKPFVSKAQAVTGGKLILKLANGDEKILLTREKKDGAIINTGIPFLPDTK
ncbi:hypothetical protein HGA88_06885 [Candidatus Roizmanbacteria bacterium]|nr:hypothetical protein [Candidatus Roizmanbacteria bacterium]